MKLRSMRVPGELSRIAAIWRASVEATHDFLSPQHIDHYHRRVERDYLPQLEVTVATDGDDRPIAFLGMNGSTVEMLFVAPEHRRSGAGSALLASAMARHEGLRLDVNEQNPDARRFYAKHGFQEIGRSATDADGNPFPLVHLAWQRGDRCEGR